jgi:putative heme-binding domain-containing protein
LQSDHAPLRLEAVRTLSLQPKPERFDVLAAIAVSDAQGDEVRLEAIMGLAAAAGHYQELLEELASGQKPSLKSEAERVLRLAGQRPDRGEDRPPADDVKAWNELLANGGDVAAGRRLFFSAAGGRCGVCHQHSGRGGRIGPDLTFIGRSNSRERIIASILLPNLEIAPHYQPWLLVTDDGKIHNGLRMPEGGDDGTEEYIDSAGNHFRLQSSTIESRASTKTSIMPSGLESTLAIDDLRHLVTFLSGRVDSSK